jgi:hypothetical protein
MRRSEAAGGEALVEAAGSSGDLAALAAKANAEHAAAQKALGESVRHAMAAGQALHDAKARVPYGQWLNWIRANLSYTNRTAALYMKLAQLSEEDSKRVSNLSMRKAIQALAVKPPRNDTPKPTLSDDSAKVIDGIIMLEGADALLAYVHSLKNPATVSVGEFDASVGRLRRRLERAET